MGPAKHIIWLTSRLRVVIEIAQSGNAPLRSISPVGAAEEKTINLSIRDSALPLVELKLGGERSRFETGKRHVRTYCCQRLLYREHSEYSQKYSGNRLINHLDVVLHDPESKIVVTVHFLAFPDVAVLRSAATVQNEPATEVVLSMVSPLVFSGFISPQWWKKYSVSYAHNTRFREAQ
ncbi:hypothetical protein ZTR_09019 [Talaromyces verruculosus]|nr:hypothetical protein ZTR_09019 [Talaromyces verruculosus]